MIRLSLICIFFLFFATSSIFSQPDWRGIVDASFQALDQEVNDSIANCRLAATKLRKEMNAIIEKKALTRSYIFGEKDEYVNEGMHKLFKKAPVKFQVSMDRDKDIVRLEELHTLLYQRDKTLFYWIGIQSKLAKHPDKMNYAKWANRQEKLPNNLRPNLKSKKACQQWVKDELVCEIARAQQTSSPAAASKKMSRFEVKLNVRATNTTGTYFEKQKLPIPPEDILCSFPTNGQFAFHPSESIPKVGYIAFSSSAASRAITKLLEEQDLKARWTAQDGELLYTPVKYEYFSGIMYFNIPSSLKSEQVYRLQLLAHPRDYKTPPFTSQICWDIFRGKNTPERQRHYANIEGETIITELYFRAGKYQVKEKLQTMRGAIDWKKGQVIFDTDEPLDPFEMYGNGSVPPPVSFSIQTSYFYKTREAINSDEVFYYLTVPRVEPTANIPLSQWLAAELDQTLDAPFIRKTTLGNAKSYPKLPDPIAIDTPLPGGYIAPAFRLNKVPDSLFTQQAVPFISKAHFKAKAPLKFTPMRCTLLVGEFRQLIAAAHSLQQQLQLRVDERVDFFYALEQRRALREGKSLGITKEELMDREMENLPPKVKLLLDAKIPDCFKNNFSLLYFRNFPGSTRKSTEYQLKFETEK